MIETDIKPIVIKKTGMHSILFLEYLLLNKSFNDSEMTSPSSLSSDILRKLSRTCEKRFASQTMFSSNASSLVFLRFAASVSKFLIEDRLLFSGMIVAFACFTTF